MTEFKPIWYTIPEFTQIKPVCVYHKENESWKEELPKIENLHVLARVNLNIAEKKSMKIRITADDYYKLYINGVYVGQGPAPSYPEHYYYNIMDITPFLREGKNVLAVHLYYQGLINRVWNSKDGRFGVACDIVSDGDDKIVPTWKYQISYAFSGDIIGYDTQFLENFDSRKWEESWNMLEYDDSKWNHMVCAPWADYCCTEQPVKMLDVYKKSPKMQKREGNTWFLDMGQEVTGALQIKAFGMENNKIIIRYAEECREDETIRYQLRCNCKYEEIWTLREGENVLEPYDYKGFRYAQLICEDGADILDIEAVIRHYPMKEELCTLESTHPYLDNIFSICKSGVKYGTQEGYLDCPTREKGQYLGDSIITAHSQIWLTGTVEMLRKCIDQFSHTSSICPGLMGVAPGAFMQEIADFSLLWSQLLMIDYQFIGDKAFLAKYYPTAKGVIEHFRQYAREDGLLEQVKDKWNLVDWPENLRDNYDFLLTRPVVANGCHNVVNALYVGAVKIFSCIEEILEIPISYDWKKLKDSYIKIFYCREKKLFTDSESSLHTSLHSNIYALYFGLYPEDAKSQIADFLLEKGFQCGVFMSYFYLKALAQVGRYQDVYRMLVNESQNGWVNMLREGATTCWEAWGKEQKWNTSLCHPWASAPIPILIEDIAGFMPNPEKLEGFYFEPHIPEEIEEFQMRIPFRGKSYIIEKKDGKTVLKDVSK